jgi:hypothetical protein
LELEDRRLLATFNVTSPADNGDTGTLRWAVAQANAAQTASVIDIELGTSPATITLALGQLELSDTSAATTISDGAGQGPVTISGGGVSRVFQLDNGVTATISGLTISDGSTTTGAGIYTHGNLTLDNCTLSGNNAVGYGGAIFTGGGDLDVSNCTIAANTSDRSGAGIEAQGSVTVISTTFFGNQTGNDGGAIDNYFGQFSVQVGDSILDGDSAKGEGPEFQNSVTSLGNNLVSETDSSTGWIGTGTMVSPLDAQLAPLGIYGGTNQTIPLLPGSPAIGAGSATDYAGTTTPITTDERGEPLDSPNPDIGAFQSQGFTISAVAGGTPQSTPDGDPFANPLAVTVNINSPDLPLPGASVTFTVNPASSGASATLSSITATCATNGVAQVSATANASSGSYTVVASVGAGLTTNFALTNEEIPTFSGITDQSITYGTANVTLGGTLSGGPRAPTSEKVDVSLDGVTQQAPILPGGDFSTTFTDTAGLAVTGSPYTINYTYESDGTFASSSTSSTLTVNKAKPTLIVTGAGGLYNAAPHPATASVAGVSGLAGPSLEGVDVVLAYYNGAYSSASELTGLTPLSAAPTAAGSYTVLGAFAGSTDYISASALAIFNVAPATPTVTVTDAGGVYAGKAFAASSAIAGLSGTPGPTLEGVGALLEYYSGTYTSASQLSGLTSLSSSPKAVGSYTVAADFPGSTDYTSASALANFTITPATPNVSVVGQSGTYSGSAFAADATVQGVTGSGSPSLEGVSPSLTYYSGTYTSASQLVGLTPVAAAPSQAGPYTVLATFAGSADYSGAEALGNFSIAPAAPTVTVTAAGGTYSGSAIAATGSVAGVSHSAGPSLEGIGVVLAYYSGTYTSASQLTSLTPLAAAPAQVGIFTVLASFAGSADYTSGTALANFTIARATPQVTWEPVASIVYGTPLGPAELDASASVAGTFAYAPAAGTVLAAGSGQALTATFMPEDTTDYTTVPATATIAVERAVPTLTLSDPGGKYNGEPFPASVTLTASGGGNAPASTLGGVGPALAYYVGAGTSGVSLGGAAPSAAGTFTVVATYPGSANYMAVSSAPVTFTIRAGTASIALNSSTGSSVFGQTITLAATVGAAGKPGGTVTFFDNGTALATVPLDGAGTATLTTGALAAGSHSITASYSGDANLTGAASGSASERVGQSATTIGLTANPILKKKKVKSETLTAEIEPVSPGAGVPTGMVTFELVTTKKQKHKTKIKTKVLGSAVVGGGEATLNLKPKVVLKKVVTVVYSGDPDFTASLLTAPKLSKKGLL